MGRPTEAMRGHRMAPGDDEGKTGSTSQQPKAIGEIHQPSPGLDYFWQDNRRTGAVRFQRRRKQLMASNRFVWSDASETISEDARPFRCVRGPHLEEAIGKPRFEDASGDGRKCGLKTEVGPAPGLFLVTFEVPEGLGLGGAEARATVGPKDFDGPGVGGPGGEALGFETDRNLTTVHLDFCVQKRVIPGIAFRHAPFAIGTLGVDFLELGIDPDGEIAQPEWDMDHMHPQVAHHSDFSAGFDLAFPIDRLGRVEVTGVPETGVDLDEPSKSPGAGELENPQGTGKERKFRTAPNKSTGSGCGVADAPGGGQIDTERLFGKEVLARRQYFQIERLVKIVGNRHIDHVDIGIAKEFAMIAGQLPDGGHLTKPVEEAFLEVADGHQFGPDRKLVQDKPAPKGAGCLPAHESAPDDSHTHGVIHGRENGKPGRFNASATN